VVKNRRGLETKTAGRKPASNHNQRLVENHWSDHRPPSRPMAGNQRATATTTSGPRKTKPAALATGSFAKSIRWTSRNESSSFISALARQTKGVLDRLRASDGVVFRIVSAGSAEETRSKRTGSAPSLDLDKRPARSHEPTHAARPATGQMMPPKILSKSEVTHQFIGQLTYRLSCHDRSDELQSKFAE